MMDVRVVNVKAAASLASAALLGVAAVAPCDATENRIYSFVDAYGVTHVTNVPTARRTTDTRLAAATPPAKRAAAELAAEARAAHYSELVDEIADRHGVDPALIRALIRVESGYNPAAVSPKGAVGLMQLMPATARRYGVADPYDASQNVLGGVRYLRDLLDLFHHDLPLTLAAYNAGEGAVARHGGIPPYAETTSYVAKVLAHYLRPNDEFARVSNVGRKRLE